MPPKKLSKITLFDKLLDGCQKGDLAKVTQAVTGGANVNQKTPNNETPLFIAVQEKHQPVVTYLLTKGASVNEKYGPNGLTALYVACSNGSLDIAKVLVDAGANVNLKTTAGFSPLYVAVVQKHQPVVEYLLTKGVSINEKYGSNGFTALYASCSIGSLNIAKVLVDAGANVNLKITEGFSPLYVAVLQKHQPVVEYLLTKGASVNEYNGSNGLTALYEACINGSLDIAKVLVDAGADINKRNKQGRTPLIGAVSGKKVRVVEYLLTKGVNINGQGTFGESALFIACEDGRLDLVKQLVEAGANINLKTYDGKTPLDAARRPGRYDVVAYLESLMQPQVEKPKWKGFTRSDVSKFDTIFGDNAINIAVCPVCLKYVERSDACMYMSHNCAALGGFYHSDLYNKYKNATGQIGWCTICGRVCVGHNHFELGLAKDAKPDAIIAAHDPFSKDCRDANGGGGLPEKFSRFRRMREFALELQDFVGSMTEEEALKALIEETWNAPLNRSLRIPKIMSERKWNISTNVFPANSAPINVHKANVNDPTKYKAPLVLIPGDADYKGNDYADDYESPVIVFTHKSASGDDHSHPQISKEMLLDMLDAAGEKQGKCFDDTCGGLLWPQEIQQAFDDPKMAPTVTDTDRERLRNYKERFNGWHASVGGKRKTMRRQRK